MATTSRQRDQRRRALTVAKLAVRAYARDPSAANAQGVQVAWRRVRRIDGIARWLQPPAFAGGAPDLVPGDSRLPAAPAPGAVVPSRPHGRPPPG